LLEVSDRNLTGINGDGHRLVIDNSPIAQHAEKLGRNAGRPAISVHKVPTRLKIMPHHALIDIVHIQLSTLQPTTEVSDDVQMHIRRRT
jgi:hypothetical protein